MKLKIPPAIQLLIFMFIMWCIAKVSDVKHFEFEYQKETSRLLFGISIAVGLISLFAFRKAQTTIDPTQPSNASKLVIVSIYKFSRNPMYLSMLVLLLGFFIRLGNFYTLPVLPIYVWYMTTFQIRPEEEALTLLFGETYKDYCNKVRRWI